MYNKEKYILKLEKYIGGIKVEEKILKEFMSEDILRILNGCEDSKKITDTLPLYMDDQDRNIEDSIYYGPTYMTTI